MTKKQHQTFAIVVAIVLIAGSFVLPVRFKAYCLLGLILGELLVLLSYYSTYRRYLNSIKALDLDENFQEELNVIEVANQHGYHGFVYDSYRIYAYYVLGMWTRYMQCAKKMSTTQAWKRPRFEEFRSKVMDNVSCILFLQGMSKGNFDYKGHNVLILQSIQDHKDGIFYNILSRIETYDQEPPLKKACLFVLAKEVDQALALYPDTSEAYEILMKIKESQNG